MYMYVHILPMPFVVMLQEWSTISPSNSPWPVLRTRHASCLIAGPLTEHTDTVLLTMGGADMDDVTQNDTHLMDLTNKTTVKVNHTRLFLT